MTQTRIQTQIGEFDDRDSWMGGLQKLGVGMRKYIASLMLGGRRLPTYKLMLCLLKLEVATHI
jgi:hypothetical protein